MKGVAHEKEEALRIGSPVRLKVTCFRCFGLGERFQRASTKPLSHPIADW